MKVYEYTIKLEGNMTLNEVDDLAELIRAYGSVVAHEQRDIIARFTEADDWNLVTTLRDFKEDFDAAYPNLDFQINREYVREIKERPV